MFKIGQIININNRQGCICFVTNYQNVPYINVSFEDNGLEFKTYSVKLKKDEVVLKEVVDKELLTELNTIFVADRIGDA